MVCMQVMPKKKTVKKAPMTMGPNVKSKGKPAIIVGEEVGGWWRERRLSPLLFFWGAKNRVHAVKIFSARN